ncbi:hypothetical protein AABM34_15205 [Lysinibacillus fusiformis]
MVPDLKMDGIGLFNWFMHQKGPIHGYTGAIWTGVTTLTLAKAMEQAVPGRNNWTLSSCQYIAYIQIRFASVIE